MTFTQEEVWLAVKAEAPKVAFDPYLVMAVCEQDCEHRFPVGGGKLLFDRKRYRSDKARLEQGYYDRYVERQNELATSSEVLLAVSWGVMQMMGLSLKEMQYFEWYFQQSDVTFRKVIGSPFSQFAVPSALDHFAVTLSVQVHYGVGWLSTKRRAAGGDMAETLLRWNGGGDPEYADKVLARMPLLKRELSTN